MVVKTHLLSRREERSQNAELKFLHLRLRPQVLMILQSEFQDRDLGFKSLVSPIVLSGCKVSSLEASSDAGEVAEKCFNQKEI